MKKILVLMAVLLSALACEEPNTTPKDLLEERRNTILKGNPSAEERRGGNGNGNGGNNPNSPNYNPCANYEIYPVENTPSTDWNFKVDTTICGFVIIRWDAQPGFVAYTDSCSGLYGKYFISVRPVVSDPISEGCAGNYTTTNAYYYQMGSGCSMWPGKEYNIVVYWYYRDVINKKSIGYLSTTYRYKTGSSAPWLSNCP
jgi:hypothetical protein